MTNQVNQAFEKWYQSKIDEANANNDMDMRQELHRNKSRYKYGYQAATKASESEINSLKQRVGELSDLLKDRQSDLDFEFNRAEQNELECNALTEDNIIMRDTLNKIALGHVYDADIIESAGDCLQRLSNSQSLAEHDNEVTAPYKKALEFAEHMAKSTEQFMIAINQLDEADQEEDEETIEIMQEKRGEHWRAVNSSIYEFRQRSDRALKASHG